MKSTPYCVRTTEGGLRRYAMPCHCLRGFKKKRRQKLGLEGLEIFDWIQCRKRAF